MTTNVAFIVIFCLNLVRTTEDENECSTYNCLFGKGTKVKKRQRKKKGWCTFTCHKCTRYPLEEHFLQHHFNNVFCSTTSTSLLQHHLLHHPFDIAFVAPSSVASLQHHICNIVLCSNVSTLLLQHCFNIVFATSSSTSLLKHRFCGLISQHCLITFGCYYNIKLLCCSNTWFLITPNHLTAPMAKLKFQLQERSSPSTNYNNKVWVATTFKVFGR